MNVSVKKRGLTVFLLALLVLSFSLSASSCIRGQSFVLYYTSIDKARHDPDYRHIYRDKENIIYSQTLEGGAVDFVLNGEDSYMLCIAKKADAHGDLYRIQSCLGFSLDMAIEDSIKDGNYHELDSTALSALPFHWLVVTKEFNESHENREAFEFEYNGVLYHLWVQEATRLYPTFPAD